MQRSPRGFTLVEVLVAAGLLVTIAAGAAHLFAIAIRHGVASRQQLAMTLVASSKIDELSARIARNDFAVSPPGVLDRATDGFADVIVEAGASFERRWLIAPANGYPSTVVVIAVRVRPVAPAAAADVELVTAREVGVP